MQLLMALFARKSDPEAESEFGKTLSFMTRQSLMPSHCALELRSDWQSSKKLSLTFVQKCAGEDVGVDGQRPLNLLK